MILLVCLLFQVVQATASNQCRDDVFLRRAYLTVTGALPSPEECVKFIDSSAPNKREALIDELLESELGIKYMQMHWGD
ncbi:MAG: DUF1549 domain-containing protein, partial [Alistipes sp.]|nr:DUF1549 domain-containing protein [Alistipes sp.]